ncbi:ATP-binding cassette domain-containing protein [Microbacterium limosum]|uniref:ATP-binding cassette domain-containing protein n=1 Tax=Microbacterium limosum TaxID=3079935 RepID=A0AAU0MDL2_9MICO|nr:ATP-binding cassette domain-containing protein [Microbacterium sp. Y20]WOQ68598.1 ATP-binding cassette domain-containing protein [Microbacterium sp. Y20]
MTASSSDPRDPSDEPDASAPAPDASVDDAGSSAEKSTPPPRKRPARTPTGEKKPAAPRAPRAPRVTAASGGAKPEKSGAGAAAKKPRAATAPRKPRSGAASGKSGSGAASGKSGAGAAPRKPRAAAVPKKTDLPTPESSASAPSPADDESTGVVSALPPLPPLPPLSAAEAARLKAAVPGEALAAEGIPAGTGEKDDAGRADADEEPSGTAAPVIAPDIAVVAEGEGEDVEADTAAEPVPDTVAIARQPRAGREDAAPGPEPETKAEGSDEAPVADVSAVDATAATDADVAAESAAEGVATADADSDSPAIAMTAVTKRFGGHTVLDAIDLTVPAGSFFGLVGPNGAGKTTSLSIMAGLLRADEGTVEIAGVDAAADPRAAKAKLGVLPDRLRTFDRLSGRQLLYYYGVLRGLRPAVVNDRIADLARVFDLRDALARSVSDYSAGMVKKIMLAGAMIHSPRVLILDEPFEAVDPESSDIILDILRSYVEHGGTVVLSSHGMGLVERVCTRVAVIVDGRVLAQGTVDDVRGDLTMEQRFIELTGGLDDAEGLEWLHNFSD